MNCSCGSGYAYAACHGAASSATYESSHQPIRLSRPRLTPVQLQNLARIFNDLSIEARVSGNDIQLRGVKFTSWCDLHALSNADGLTANWRTYLGRRSSWLGISDEPASRAEYEDLLRPVFAAQAFADEADLAVFQRMLDGIAACALSDELSVSGSAVSEFVRLSPLATIDLINERREAFMLLTLMNAVRNSAALDPDEILRAHRRSAASLDVMSVASITEPLVRRNGPHLLEGFVSKRLDSSLVFRFGQRVDLGPIARSGITPPGGVPMVMPPTPRPIRRLLMDSTAQSRYFAVAAERALHFLHCLSDPLTFRAKDSPDTLDATAWVGAYRSARRIVSLTEALQGQASDTERIELMLGLSDLYDSFGLPRIPSDTVIDRLRAWLPEEMRAHEIPRLITLRDEFIDEIWDGVTTGKEDGDRVRLPTGETMSRRKYAEAFVLAMRNSARHGFHGNEARARMDGVLFVHSGDLPTSYPSFAIPYFEAFLGDPERAFRRFVGRRGAKRTNDANSEAPHDAHHSSLAVARSEYAEDDQAFIEAITDDR